MALFEAGESPEFLPVAKCKMNPKSVTQRQLYGRFDNNTHEWSDGILANAVRHAANAKHGPSGDSKKTGRPNVKTPCPSG